MADDVTKPGAAPKETYDDRPFHSEHLPPEVRAPLAPYKGEAPASPAWFQWAIAQEPERSFVGSHGARLEAGEIILAGSFTRPMWVSRGDVVRCDYREMGVIECRFV